MKKNAPFCVVFDKTENWICVFRYADWKQTKPKRKIKKRFKQKKKKQEFIHSQELDQKIPYTSFNIYNGLSLPIYICTYLYVYAYIYKHMLIAFAF